MAKRTADVGEFQKLLADFLDGFEGSKGDLAKALGVTPSRLSHLFVSGNPGFEVCLRLAEVGGYAPVKVLRAAGKHEAADLVEDLFYASNAAERQQAPGKSDMGWRDAILKEARKLTPERRRKFDAFLEQVDNIAAAR